MKVCNSLKNRSRDVRDVARDTLIKMATSLGPKYLQYVIKEMKELLTRGYQVHTHCCFVNLCIEFYFLVFLSNITL